MFKHYAWAAWDEGYEYIGMHDDSSPPPSAIECTPPTHPQFGGYMRYNPTVPEWYWPTEAVKRFERVWRFEQWAGADVGLMLAQDGNAKAVGTVQDWQDYKNALRDWPDNPSIEPESVLRPQKPTA